MSKSEKDLEIVSELAKEIAEENDSTKEKMASDGNNDGENLADYPEEVNEDSSQDVSKTKSDKKKKKPTKEKPSLSLKALTAKKENQNLAERKILLIILAVLLGVQLIFMNAVVLLIILWGVFDRDSFRELNPDVLRCVLDFTKYYVTAVLVELLSGIIYIITKVFSRHLI